MKKWQLFIVLPALSFFAACSPVAPTVTHLYQINTFSHEKVTKKRLPYSIFISQPAAISSLQTNQMLYMNEPYKLNSFAQNAWAEPPADMLLPLIVQSLQQSGSFYAVAASPNYEKTDYRLTTQVLDAKQNFLSKPSTFDLSTKVILTRVSDNHIIAARTITQHIPCPSETPYGGVVAANQAAKQFTTELINFIMAAIPH